MKRGQTMNWKATWAVALFKPNKNDKKPVPRILKHVHWQLFGWVQKTPPAPPGPLSSGTRLPPAGLSLSHLLVGSSRGERKEEYANAFFGEVVLVVSVAGQKMIKLNKWSVLSDPQIRSGRSWREAALQEAFFFF